MTDVLQHVSRHKVGPTMVHLIADSSERLSTLLALEKQVIERFRRDRAWKHRWITLFVLEDLEPLLAQMRRLGDLPDGEAAFLHERPMVNVYRVDDPRDYAIFVNRRVMVESGFWNDDLAVQALLAHEHAHPLTECRTTAGARRLRSRWRVAGWPDAPPVPAPGEKGDGRRLVDIGDPRVAGCDALEMLGQKLCLHGPQEVLANEFVVRRGFAEALWHLDRRSIAVAADALAKRDTLWRGLNRAAARGRLTREDVGALGLIGDLQVCATLTLEIAPFLRTNRFRGGRALEARLIQSVFPRVEPEVADVYRGLRDLFVSLRRDLAPDALKTWCRDAGDLLAAAMRRKGVAVTMDIVDREPAPPHTPPARFDGLAASEVA